mgnify:CR=1 FL=1
MILQALTEYYRALEREGKITAPGWSPVKVSFALYLGTSGTLEQMVSIQTEQPKGKKMVLAPQNIPLPAPVKRTVGVAANFLCDNSSYLLGIDNKGKPQRTLECFAACKELHENLLKDVDSPAAQSVLAFFRTWDPEKARENPILAECLEDILAGGNLIFRTENGYVHEDPAVRRAWETYYNSAGGGPQGICLVTGEMGPIENIHPSIKNVVGAQSSGAALVSFNAPAFCSYGKEQNLNAPTGKFASFAYTAALNHLLADRDHIFRIGDATVVCWAGNAKPAYAVLFGGAFFGSPVSYTENDLRGMIKSLCSGQQVVYDEDNLDPDMDFYILGLSPNAARLSVRFFLHNTFGGFLRNLQAHYDRLEIVRPTYDKFETLPLWKLLSETVNENSRDKAPAPELAGEVLWAVLMNTRYPATLLNGATLRIRAEREVTRGRAAILKAYYIKLSEAANRENPDIPKEVLQVTLNPDASNIPYTLGRLFSVMEAIQEAANPGINATIKDKYFNSAAATPAVIFPVLTNLAQKHLKKLRSSNRGLSIVYDKQLTELFSKLEETEYPARMNLPQQGSFQLGYYHQTQARYQKKEEKEHV